MGFLNLHKKRLNIQPCNNRYRNEYEYNTKKFINTHFSQSPLYDIVKIDNKDIEVRIVESKNYKTNTPYEEKVLLLRPNTVVQNGSYVHIIDKNTNKNGVWLLTFYESHILYPKCYIRYCNKSLSYSNNKYPCVVTTKVSLSSDIEENKIMALPKGHLLVLVQANNETLSTKDGERFLIDGIAYEVQEVNIVSNTENKIGIVEMNLKEVPKNFEEEIVTNKNKVTQKVHTQNNEVNMNKWEW